MTVIVDASAILEVLQGEAGADAVIVQAQSALMSAVNFSEMLAKASDLSIEVATLQRGVAGLELQIESFTEGQAIIAAGLRPMTRALRFSQADRACLALGIDKQLPILTGDRVWMTLDLGVDIRMIR